MTDLNTKAYCDKRSCSVHKKCIADQNKREPRIGGDRICGVYPFQNLLESCLEVHRLFSNPFQNYVLKCFHAKLLADFYFKLKDLFQIDDDRCLNCHKLLKDLLHYNKINNI